MRPPLPVRVGRALRDVAHLVLFLRRRRSIWISVFVVLLLVVTGALTVVQTAAVSPYVYTLF